MPIQLTEESGGKVLVVHVTGTLTKADYGPLVAEFERLLGAHGKLRVLFDMTGLHGWDAGAAWEDLKFDIKHVSDIERLAIVGDEKWHHWTAVIFGPFTKATNRYFDSANAGDALKWLGS